MKNQYFGDVNDYKKYGLLRLLSNNGRRRVAICWMLTGADERADGKLIGYLNDPGKWRKYDPRLFDLLKPCLSDPTRRNVSWAEEVEIVPGAKYHAQLLTDNADERERYFQTFQDLAQGCDLSFFDPDNGLEIKSRSYGRRNSCKYLYWGELKQIGAEGQSLLLYQHFPREERQKFIEKVVSKVRQELKISDVITYRTDRVVFVLIPQARDKAYYLHQSQDVTRVWGDHLHMKYWECS